MLIFRTFSEYRHSFFSQKEGYTQAEAAALIGVSVDRKQSEWLVAHRQWKS